MPTESNTARLTLSNLPTEVRLRVLDFVTTAALLKLTQTSRSWHALIDAPDQDYLIYYHRTVHPEGVRDLSFLKRESTCFSHLYTDYANVNSWRDLCRCQTLLGRAWSRDAPTVRTSLIAPRRANDYAPFGAELGLDPHRMPVWRFRPDFERRFVLATTQHGGLLVTDMDTGVLLWSRDRHEVRSYAHLEYSNGWCAFDRQGNAIEIWRHVDGEDTRGSFEKVADLSHDVETRGFQMLWPTLCVVSTEEQGFVYDLSAAGGPKLTNRMEISDGVVGHIEQDANDTVVYSLGLRGYDFHSKSTGNLQGCLVPKTLEARGVYHVSHRHGDTLSQSILSKPEPIAAPFPPRQPPAIHKPQSQPLGHGGNLAREVRVEGEEEWGASLIRGDLFVAISKAGRCMICLDWPGAIRSAAHASKVTFFVEMEINAHTYDFGGWLGVQRGPPGPTRIICEVDDKVYVMRLTTDTESLINGTQSLTEAMDVLSFPASCAPNIGVPISFMGVYDDCIMHTCLVGVIPRGGANRPPYVAKAIRVISFAPTPLDLGRTGYPAQTAINGFIGERDEEDDEWEDIDVRQFQEH